LDYILPCNLSHLYRQVDSNLSHFVIQKMVKLSEVYEVMGVPMYKEGKLNNSILRENTVCMLTAVDHKNSDGKDRDYRRAVGMFTSNMKLDTEYFSLIFRIC